MAGEAQMKEGQATKQKKVRCLKPWPGVAHFPTKEVCGTPAQAVIVQAKLSRSLRAGCRSCAGSCSPFEMSTPALAAAPNSRARGSTPYPRRARRMHSNLPSLVCRHCINALYFHTYPQEVVWPDAEMRQALRGSFTHFPNAVAACDGYEQPIQDPRTSEDQYIWWSVKLNEVGSFCTV